MFAVAWRHAHQNRVPARRPGTDIERPREQGIDQQVDTASIGGIGNQHGARRIVVGIANVAKRLAACRPFSYPYALHLVGEARYEGVTRNRSADGTRYFLKILIYVVFFVTLPDVLLVIEREVSTQEVEFKSLLQRVNRILGCGFFWSMNRCISVQSRRRRAPLTGNGCIGAAPMLPAEP